MPEVALEDGDPRNFRVASEAGALIPLVVERGAAGFDANCFGGKEASRPISRGDDLGGVPFEDTHS